MSSNQDEIHVRLLTDSLQPLGAGLLYNRHFVLTANHCVRRVDRVLVEYGEVRVPGVVRERVVDHDTALIQLLDPVELIAPWRPLDTCLGGDGWYTSYRPTTKDPVLSGRVDEPSVEYKCENGGTVIAAQLITTQTVGDYAGYSGSPVARDRPGAPATMIGMLIEQYPDRQNPDRASNVLFATTLQPTLRQFSLIGPENSIVELQYIPRQREPVAREKKASELLDAGEEYLQRIQEWAARGLLPIEEIPALQAMVARQVIEKGLS
ncbi:serine protease [Actinoplanes sp. NBC_00393]|uniref:trypsin-like peptidase domain-containing protein n=1 Tax=Actinoplanes sp. NBC_00393 TaxID=2975953 RepID=UPI002E213858